MTETTGCTGNTAMSNTDQAQDAELHAMVDSLHARLVATGEWARLVKKLRGDLHGTSWESNLRNFAHGECAYVGHSKGA